MVEWMDDFSKATAMERLSSPSLPLLRPFFARLEQQCPVMGGAIGMRGGRSGTRGVIDRQEEALGKEGHDE